MSQIGVLYLNGSGTEKNPIVAMVWLRRGADAGDAYAMGQIGWMYETGTGVKSDLDESQKWYKQGAGLKDIFTRSRWPPPHQSTV